MAFNEKHPDFGQHAMFYVNMDKGDKTFEGAGTLKERFEILLAQGFELGNHTWGHVKYSEPVNNFSIKFKRAWAKIRKRPMKFTRFRVLLIGAAIWTCACK